MYDNYGRSIEYLRLSITDLCNLRCQYCMPAEGICKKSHFDMMTEQEMITAVRAAASLGVTKVRLTGGEPLVKRNVVSICQHISEIPEITELCMTTNATLLTPKLARKLRSAGLHRLNISLDTLNPEKYREITRIGNLEDAFAGIHTALDIFDNVKINAVLIKGFNDDEVISLSELTRKFPIDMRFIEFMPMPYVEDLSKYSYMSVDNIPALLDEAGIGYSMCETSSRCEAKSHCETGPHVETKSHYETGPHVEAGSLREMGTCSVTGSHIEVGSHVDGLPAGYNDSDAEKAGTGTDAHSVARMLRLDGAIGRVGLISPVSNKFCSRCNRIRITADGKVKPCLHSSSEYDIRRKNEDEVREIIKQAIAIKPKSHLGLDGGKVSESARSMNAIGG